MKYPVYKPLLNGNEKKYVNECLDSTWISSKGQFVDKFESEFAHYIGAKHAISVSNGTVALHVALLALGIGEGDEVLVPSFTYIASVNAIKYTNAKPVFVECDPKTLLIDLKDAESKITSKTKALMCVHLYGDSCNMDEILDFGSKHQLKIIEDAAESFGTTFKNKHTGTFGDIGTFSFFGNKTITTGEGGMITTNDDDIFNFAMRIKGQGLAANREYWHDIIGYNYRMTNICAAIGLAQLENAKEVISKKRAIANWYKQELSNCPVITPSESDQVVNSFWMINIIVESEVIRDSLREHLKRNGIETRPSFFPVHLMPMYYDESVKLPITEDISLRGINLPSYPELAEEDIKIICSCIREFYEAHSSNN